MRKLNTGRRREPHVALLHRNDRRAYRSCLRAHGGDAAPCAQLEVRATSASLSLSASQMQGRHLSGHFAQGARDYAVGASKAVWAGTSPCPVSIGRSQGPIGSTVRCACLSMGWLLMICDVAFWQTLRRM